MRMWVWSLVNIAWKYSSDPACCCCGVSFSPSSDLTGSPEELLYATGAALKGKQTTNKQNPISQLLKNNDHFFSFAQEVGTRQDHLYCIVFPHIFNVILFPQNPTQDTFFLQKTYSSLLSPICRLYYCPFSINRVAIGFCFT